MKNRSHDQLNPRLPSDGGEKIRGRQSVETVSVSKKDLLQLEKKTSVLEKRLLVCKDGEKLRNARCSKKREPPTIGPMPESDVLERIKSFLPTLSQANTNLFSDIQARGADEFNVELITENEERYVEMDLALGVAQLRTPEALAAAELATNGQVLKVNQSDKSSDCSSSEHDSDDDDNDDDESSSRKDLNGLSQVMRWKESKQSSRIDQQHCGKDKSHLRRKKIELL